jgi:hypothetical protein
MLRPSGFPHSGGVSEELPPALVSGAAPGLGGAQRCRQEFSGWRGGLPVHDGGQPASQPLISRERAISEAS